VSNIVRTESKPRHLAALWKCRQKAHAGSTPSVKRDYTRNSCEFIHCKCSICVSFKNSAGGWCSEPYRGCVGCKCVRCQPWFSATGHWDADIAQKRGSVGQFNVLLVQSPVSRFTAAMQLEEGLVDSPTQCQLSSQQIKGERRRVRAALDRHRQALWGKHLATVSGVSAPSPAQFRTQVRRHIPAPTLSLGMQSHFPTLMAAMVCSAVAHGDTWANARHLVDAGNEHPHLISQTLADTLGLSGPIAGRATQANGKYLPLRDVGDLDLMVNGQVVKQRFLSAPLFRGAVAA
jgi:hypothetical protein